MTWFAFLTYVAATLCLGWYAHKNKETADDFWTAGRSLSGFSVGLSISAGFISVSWSCVYAVQLFYWYGIGAVWLITVPWLTALTGIYFLADKYRQLESFSQPEMVGKRFGKSGKRLIAIALACVFLVWGGAEIYVAATLLAPGLKIPVNWVIGLISLVVGIYSVMGGFRAVVLTDKLQYGIVALYICGMAVLAGLGLQDADLNVNVAPLQVNGAKSGLHWTNLIAPGLGVILLTLAAYLPGWLFETDLWLRVQAAKDKNAARKGVLLAGLNGLLFVGLLPMFIGISALYIFPMTGNEFPAAIGREGDAVFAALTTRYAPGWVSVLFSVGLTAAAMSTIDTCVNVMALSLSYDLAEISKKPSAHRWSKIITALSVSAACIFALNTESLWDIFYLSSGILTTAVAFPVAAVFIKKANPSGVLWSSAAGFGGTVLFYFLEIGGLLKYSEPDWMQASGLGYILWGMAAAAVGYVIGSLLAPRSAPELKIKE